MFITEYGTTCYLCAKNKDSYYAYVCLMYPENENAMPIVLFQYANFQAK